MKYFCIEEFLKSETADRLGIDNRTPFYSNPTLCDNLKVLVEEVLDPLREMYDAPLVVTSGFRCDALNKAVGGSPTSSHRYALAADIVAGDMVSLWQCAKNLNLVNDFVDQIIDEKKLQWVHIGIKVNPKKARHQVLKFANGKYSRV